jgi:hypothetical protein
MKQAEPNPLQRELARSQQGGLHPDADLLAAFAEGSLLEREREEMFAHLASCAECREVLNAAMEAQEEPVAELKPFRVAAAPRSPIRTWIPWMSVAAGIALVCSAGLLYRQRLEMKEQAGAENTEQMSATARPAPPMSAEPSEGVSASATKPSAGKLKSAEPAAEVSPVEPVGGMPSEGPKQALANYQDLQVESAMARDARDKSAGAAQAMRDESGGASQAIREKPALAGQAKIEESVATAPAPTMSAPGLVAQEPSREMNNASARALSKTSFGAIASRPKWRIDSTGRVERAIGGGEWQKVIPDEKAIMRVVSVSSGEVWVGGDNARLYHSVDSGNTWNAVTLPVKDGRDHAIVHISFQTRQTGVVQADDGTSWSTADGGVSWK